MHCLTSDVDLCCFESQSTFHSALKWEYWQMKDRFRTQDKTDPMPQNSNHLPSEGCYWCTQQIFVYTFKSYLGMGEMTVWWGDSRASRFKSPSADVRTWWVSCMWGLSYSQTKLNEEGLIWPECPALLNRTLSLRALLRDNVCFVAQSSERGGWERVEGDGGSVRDSTQLLWQLVLAPWVH